MRARLSGGGFDASMENIAASIGGGVARAVSAVTSMMDKRAPYVGMIMVR
jgi:hypothetical protein